MKKLILLVIPVALVALVFVFLSPISKTVANIDNPFIEREPDIPAMLQNAKSSITKEEFLEQRANGSALKRGLNNDLIPNPLDRPKAVVEMDRQQSELAERPSSPEQNSLLASWTAIGPNPIVVGAARNSGRVIAIAIHPTNPDIVYVGTAQGGLYRSTNGGTSWTALMDGAQSLAIGAIAISPSNPETVYVGTGEPNFSLDSFFGVGVYRIDNASTTATLSGPFNTDAGSANVFVGRSIGEIVVHPTDPNTIFLGTTSGLGGIGGVGTAPLPSRGVFRSTNAAGATPTFAKLTGLAGSANASIRDIAIDPTNPNVLVASVVSALPLGGLYRTADALAAVPTFTQTFAYTSGTTTSELNAELTSIRPTGSTDATFYAATGNLGGRVLRSTDGGVTWTEQIDNNFCTPQCFYDIAIAVDPTNADRVYLAGAPAVIAAFSTTGGTSFTEGGAGVHVDSQAIEVSRSNPTIVYLGTDGGIYKSTNSGASYTHLNTAQFFATQFMSVAVHPTDANFTIGGTQDNGTNYYDSAASGWVRVDGGDGGYTVIDQTAPDITNVRMYHTYFSQTNNVVGYATRQNTTAGWGFRGCNGGVSNNGITCADQVLFYAPLEGGPGNPNSIYYGTDRLYRSGDFGIAHAVVSQVFGTPISSIGISRQNDNVRIVGTSNGGIFGTNAGSATLTDYDTGGQVPAGFISRSVIDPTNPAVAYVTISNFNLANVWKTTNLDSGTPTWTNISTGIPQIPVSSFVINPQNTNTLYAGTDIGVYVSTNGGTSWSPFGTGLPRVAVFGMAITNGTPRKLRIATHGKGMYEIPLNVPQGRRFMDFDGDSKTDISIFRPAPGEWWINRSSDNGNFATQFGNSSDKLAPADFTGDGKTDITFFRPSTGEWYVLRSENSTFFAFPFGTNGDIPAPDDYDGDGRADATVFRPSSNTWFISRSSGGTDIIGFGATGDKPVVGDYDGDGKADIAIYRNNAGTSEWWIRRSSNATVFAAAFGASTDKAVQGDYTGDGKTDIAVWRPSNGNWFILRSEDFSFFAFPFGTTGDVPVAGDYDGDGRFDAGVFRPSSNTWFVQRSTAGTLIQAFGIAGDQPLPNVFVP